jgi:hypothetical protein
VQENHGKMQLNLKKDSNQLPITNEIHFVFLGSKLPAYAKASIQLAASTSGVDLCLIGNRSILKSVRHLPVNFTAIEDFYDYKEFNLTKGRITSDHKYRNGIWLKSLERFFVIYQYMLAHDRSSILHAELDQLIFRAERLSELLENTKLKGIFFPFHSESSAIASIVYINDILALKSLINFSQGDYKYANEMVLVAEWAKQNPELIFQLPTVATLLQSSSKSFLPSVKLLTANELGGVVDAAQLGQWIAGIDPKHLKLSVRPRTLFVDLPSEFLLSREQLETLRFIQNEIGAVNVLSDSGLIDTPLYNLHIHSKIHPALVNGKISISKVLDSASKQLQIEIPGAREQQILGWIESKIYLARRIARRVFRILLMKE